MKTLIITAIMATVLVAGAQERRHDYFWEDMAAANAYSARMRRETSEGYDRILAESRARGAAIDAQQAAFRAHMDAEAIVDAINASKK